MCLDANRDIIGNIDNNQNGRNQGKEIKENFGFGVGLDGAEKRTVDLRDQYGFQRKGQDGEKSVNEDGDWIFGNKIQKQFVNIHEESQYQSVLT